MERACSSMTTVSDYEYAALDSEGLRSTGAVSAASPDEAIASLRRQGLVATHITRRSAAAVGLSRGPSAADHAAGLRALADALQAGLPLAKALDLCEDLVPESWRTALPSIRESVRIGRPLSSALSAPALRLPQLVLSLAEAGEATGQLAGTLRRGAEYCDANARLSAELRQALAYPTLLAVSGGISLSLMLGVVLPQFAAILADLGQQLPVSTRLVLWLAETGRFAVLAGLTIAAVVALYVSFLRREAAGRHRLAAWLLVMPAVGPLRRMYSSARLADALALTLAAGVPIRQALILSSEATGDPEISHRAKATNEALKSGVRLSDAMAQTALTTELVIRLVRSGELTGSLSGALQQAARLESGRADRRVRALVQGVEPTLILIFAILVGVVAVAMLQAIYALRPF